MPEDASPASSVTGEPTVDFSASTFFLNRELSWLEFNSRVLEEAERTDHPLLERAKFLAIYFNNLDEFFMIRVSGLREQLSGGVLDTPPDGMTPAHQLAAIGRVLQAQFARVAQVWEYDLRTTLRQTGIHLLEFGDLMQDQRLALRDYFAKEIFPALTPLAFDPTHPFPHISNLSLNLAVVARDPEKGTCFARIKVPDPFPRLVPVPAAVGEASDQEAHFVWLEDLIAANLDLLFPGLSIQAWYPFRVTRDADLDLEEDEAADLLEAIEEQVDLRHFGSVVRLEIAGQIPDSIRDLLVRNLQLAPYQVQTYEFRLGLAQLMELTRLDRPDLKFAPFQPALSDFFGKQNGFQVIREREVALYHPYQSFLPIVEFVRQAAADPQVLAIKQTLYRVGANSPIVEALVEARQNGKQVAVLLELKARFDEENNIEWARRLEDEGVHVVYGVLGLKTHAKLCMVVRRDADRIRRYLHLGTGNYNPVTSRIYTDFSFLTCDNEMGEDATDLFNSLTGYSRKAAYHKLLVAPHGLREQLLTRIDREIQRHQRHGDGYLAFKMNALVDPACIRKLYEASRAGVSIDLLVRGICCLRPGLQGISETIRVRSIVGRFLEHSRLFYFRHGGDDELLLGSADLMPRNLDRRVEILFPIGDRRMREDILRQIFEVNWRDTVNARELMPDGAYVRLGPAPGEVPFNSQESLLQAAKDGLLLAACR
ncbi:MAG: polyphosphate kinase 1 [Nitrospiraceae bacterium]